MHPVPSAIVLILAAAAATGAFAQSQPAFVAPPRTIADITAILDQERPDPKVVAKLRANAGAAPPAHAGRGELATFHYDRCIARSALGEFRGALADCEKAVELTDNSVEPTQFGRVRQGCGIQYLAAGEPRKALELLFKFAQHVDAGRSVATSGRGFLFTIQRNIVAAYLRPGGPLRQGNPSFDRGGARLEDVRRVPARQLGSRYRVGPSAARRGTRPVW